MNFEFKDYYWHLYTSPLTMIVFMSVALFTLLFLAYIHIKSSNVNLKKILIFVFSFSSVLFFMYTLVNISNFRIHQDQPSILSTTSGEIVEVKSGFRHDLLYHYEGHSVMAKYITIGDQEYYIMTIGDFEVGDEVKIWYLPNSLVVMRIEYLNQVM